MFSKTYNALLKEAEFTKEMLGVGATQIRNANYASKGVYFQAFTSLSTGLERIGKLCLMLDHYLDNSGKFPSLDYMQNKIGHKIMVIYEKATSLVAKRSLMMEYLQNLDAPIHHAILHILSEFAQGDRYSNINLLIGNKRQNDPVASWFTGVDVPLFESHVSNKKKDIIRANAAAVARMLGPHSMVLHTAETGGLITDMEEASFRTGLQKAVAPYRQLYVLQIIRYWVELLRSLQYEIMKDGSNDIPSFGEIFALFSNDDSYIRTRKTWNCLYR